MGFTIRQIEAECKFSTTLTVEALARAIPQAAIQQVLAQYPVARARERKLTLLLTVWLVIALHLYPLVSIGGVLAKLARGLRFIWPDPAIRLPSDSAIAYRREQVGGDQSWRCSSRSVSRSPQSRPAAPFCSACA